MLFKLEHLFNSGLMFLFLVYLAGHSAAAEYGYFATALAYYYLFLLLLNSTALEPMQLVLSRPRGNGQSGSALATAQNSSLLTWLAGLLVVAAAAVTQPVSLESLLAVYLAGLLGAQTQIARRMMLAMGRRRALVIAAAWNLVSLAVALSCAALGWSSPALAFLCWQGLSGLACGAWLLRERTSSGMARARHLAAIRRFFSRYALRNLMLVPTAWLFGNFVFVAGPLLLSAGQISDYRKAMNFTSPLLQYFSITGVIFLSRCAASPGLATAVRGILRAAVKRLAMLGAYALAAIACVAALAGSEGVWRYLPSHAAALPLFLASLAYVYVESLNYLAGSAFRANRMMRPLALMSVLPCVALCAYSVLLRPATPTQLVIAATLVSLAVLTISIRFAPKLQP